MGKVYKGESTRLGGQSIMVLLPNSRVYPLKHIRRHSPDGFRWGYGGSAPADAALSILHDCVGKEDAYDFYQDFKWDFIAGAGSTLEVREEDIRTWLQKQKDKRALVVFQVANCVGCRFADPERIRTGDSCCTRAGGIETDESGKRCLVRREALEQRRNDG